MGRDGRRLGIVDDGHVVGIRRQHRCAVLVVPEIRLLPPGVEHRGPTLQRVVKSLGHLEQFLVRAEDPPLRLQAAIHLERDK